jgi:hypothetical protein
LRSNLQEAIPHIGPDAIVVSLMKGVEAGTGLRMSEVMAAEGIESSRIAVVSGPNLALEIAREQPTAAVASSESEEVASAVALAATNSYFKTFINTDVVGTEFGGVLKNLIAVAVGIADGVGYGENTKASIITRGLAEISAFAAAFGATPHTMSGLAGLGDLIATCESPLSRNNTAGRLLGQGHSFTDVVASMNQTAEGLSAVKPVLELAAGKGILDAHCHSGGSGSRWLERSPRIGPPLRDRFGHSRGRVAVLTTVGTSSLVAEKFGSGQTEVLALHGWGRNGVDFARILAPHNGLALHLPGFGPAPQPPTAWSSADYAQGNRPGTGGDGATRGGGSLVWGSNRGAAGCCPPPPRVSSGAHRCSSDSGDGTHEAEAGVPE